MINQSGKLVNETCIMYFYRNLIHRDNDLPAYKSHDGKYFEWNKKGRTHRGNGLPAIIDLRSSMCFWCDEKGTRIKKMNYDEGFLIIGDKELCTAFTGVIEEKGIYRKYVNGVYHRENDLPAHIGDNSRMVWYRRGKVYRDYGLPNWIDEEGTRHWSESRKITLEELNGALVVGFLDEI